MSHSETFLTVGLQNPDKVSPSDLVKLYIDWKANYFSIERFADDYGITPSQAAVSINAGSAMHDAHTAWLKAFTTHFEANNNNENGN